MITIHTGYVITRNRMVPEQRGGDQLFLVGRQKTAKSLRRCNTHSRLEASKIRRIHACEQRLTRNSHCAYRHLRPCVICTNAGPMRAATHPGISFFEARPASILRSDDEAIGKYAGSHAASTPGPERVEAQPRLILEGAALAASRVPAIGHCPAHIRWHGDRVIGSIEIRCIPARRTDGGAPMP